MRLRYLSGLLGCFLFASTASISQAPPTIKEALAREGIGSSEQELLNALHNSNRSIRGMAAGQLAENRDTKVLPALNQALGEAQDEHERLNIATALNSLGDPKGVSAMAMLCADDSASVETRLLAANRLQELGNESCFMPVVKMTSADHNPVLDLDLLSYLLRSKESLSPSSQFYLSTTLHLESALRSEVAMTRQAAAACIAKYHMTDARLYLEQAIQKEADPATKASMESSENILERQR